MYQIRKGHYSRLSMLQVRIWIYILLTETSDLPKAVIHDLTHDGNPVAEF